MGAVPTWIHGVIPPINPLDPISPDRSPYSVALPDLILHFNMSPERRVILEGFLEYRKALHAVGLTDGFQWLDGSFMEDVENLENRPPKDIDVVTFYQLPAGVSQADVFNKNPMLFDHDHVKATFKVDAYPISLGASAVRLVKQSAYWYSMWSHRRNDHWKGYLEVPLSPNLDNDALVNLAPELMLEEANEAN